MTTLAPVTTVPVGTVEVLRGMHSLLDRVDTSDVVGGSAAAGAVGEADRVIARMQAVRLALLAEADRCEVASQTGLSGTSAWLAAATRTDGAAASRDVRLASALDNGLPATREALTAGDVSTEHARVIATTAAQLPDGLRRDQRAAIELSLVAAAKQVDPAALRKHARRALAAAEATQAEVDAHEDRLLRSEEDNAFRKTRLTWHHHDNGTTTGHFTLPTLAAGILIQTVQQLASPRRFAQQAARQAKAQQPVRLGNGGGGHGESQGASAGPVASRSAVRGSAVHGAAASASAVRGSAVREAATSGSAVREATWEAFRAAEGDWAHRYGKAFLELVEHLPTDKLSGKVAATVVVTIDRDVLLHEVGVAHLDTGHDISASEARRLACNAGILPAVLDGGSVPLDLGRQNRFFSEPQRVALATTYDTCAAGGCDRPYSWSELHHEDPWGSGGVSDLHLAVPLCGDHHRRIHDPRYTHRIQTSALGKKSVTYSRRS